MPASPLVELRDYWRHQVPCQAVVAGDKIVATMAGCVLACDASGRIQWLRRQAWIPLAQDYGRKAWYEASHEPPVAHGDRVYATQPGVWDVECIELATGRLAWRRPLGGLTRVLGRTAKHLLVETDGQIVALHPDSGKPLWASDVKNRLETRFCAQPESLMCVQWEPNKEGDKPPQLALLALDPQTGQPRSRSLLPLPAKKDPWLKPLVICGDRAWCFSASIQEPARREIFELVPAKTEERTPSLVPEPITESLVQYSSSSFLIPRSLTALDRKPTMTRMRLAMVAVMGAALAASAGDAAFVRAADDWEITPKSEQALDRGLEWLARNQGPQGNWESNDLGLVSTGALAFLAAGHLPGRGKHGETVQRALDYVVHRAQTSGLLNISEPRRGMYNHGLSTFVLGQAYGMSADQRISTVLDRALKLIAQTQCGDGGWDQLPPRGHDLSSADAGPGLRMPDSGLEVPPEVVELAIKSVRGHYSPKGCSHTASEEEQKKYPGQFTYSRGGGNSTVAMAAAGVVCLQEFGQYDDWRIEKSMEAVTKAIRSREMEDATKRRHLRFDPYTLYYVAQALYQVGGEHGSSVIRSARQRAGQPGSEHVQIDGDGGCAAGTWAASLATSTPPRCLLRAGDPQPLPAHPSEGKIEACETDSAKALMRRRRLDAESLYPLPPPTQLTTLHGFDHVPGPLVCDRRPGSRRRTDPHPPAQPAAVPRGGVGGHGLLAPGSAPQSSNPAPARPVAHAGAHACGVGLRPGAGPAVPHFQFGRDQSRSTGPRGPGNRQQPEHERGAA